MFKISGIYESLNSSKNIIIIIYVQSLKLYISDYFQSGRVLRFAASPYMLAWPQYTVDTSTLVLFNEQWE